MGYEMLCIGLYRLKGPDFGINSEEIDEDEREIRVVLTAPHKDLTLDEEDIAFMLVQYVDEKDDEPKESRSNEVESTNSITNYTQNTYVYQHSRIISTL